MAFPFAPWAAEWLAGRLGTREGPVRLLPCPGTADSLLHPRITGPVFRSAFHMSVHMSINRNKNADGAGREAVHAARVLLMAVEAGREVVK